MLLIIEIALVVAAWKRGWKGLALVPIVAGFALAFMLGGAVGASGGSEDAAFALGLLVDVGIIATLAIMAVVGRRTHAAGQTVAGAGQQEMLPSAEAGDRVASASPVRPVDLPSGVPGTGYGILSAEKAGAEACSERELNALLRFKVS